MIYQTYKVYFITLLVAGTMLCSCSGGSEKTTKKDTNASKDENKDKKGGLELSPEQMRSMGIVTGPIEKKNLESVVKANGQLAVPPQNKADVSILSGGIISHINVLEGQKVRKGQVLASIKNQDLIKLQQDYLAAKNNFAYVQVEYVRQSQLKAAGAGTGKSFQSSQATYNAERSKITAYESQLSQLAVSPGKITNGNIVSQFPVLSPIGGTVGTITASIGAFVQPGTSIMEVVDNSKIHCDLTVFEKDLIHVKIGQKINFQLTNQDNQVITGVISGINKSFENESKGVIVHAVINNKEHPNLIPGMYVTALISTGSKLVDAVPLDAVVRSEGKQYIFVASPTQKDGKITFTKTEIRAGVSELGYIQITPLTPIAPDVRIAPKGAFYLQSKAAGSADEE